MAGLFAKLQQFYQVRFARFISARIKPSRRITLNRDNLFVFPSLTGFLFLGLLTVLWLLATNYENNLAHGLVYLLVSISVVAILHTYSNLAGLTITAVRAHSCHAGEDAEFEILVSRNDQRDSENVLLQWPDNPVSVANIIHHRQCQVRLFVTTTKRGWMKPGRLLVESYYPLGLIRTWTWLDLDCKALVYPKPINAGPVPPAMVSRDEGQLLDNTGSEDFSGLKEYQPGDSLKHVAWKRYARGQGLHTKEYSAFVDQRVWLDWDYFAGMAREARLSRLCFWVLEMHSSRADYGLRIPGIEIPPGKGVEHQQRLLKTLALFEVNE